MRHVFVASAFLGANLLFCCGAFAHFLWIDWQPASDGPSMAKLIFSDKPRAEGRDLTEKFKHARLWSRTAAGQVSEITFTRGAGADAKTLVAKVAARNGVCLEAEYDYGVYTRGPQNVLLHYYAKALPSDWQRRGESFARSQRLQLDVIPRWHDGAIALTVLFHGKPAAGQDLVLLPPSGEQRELKTDAQGVARFEHAAAGRYFIRAGYIEADRGGQLDGKTYVQTGYYCTASFLVGVEQAGPRTAEAHAAPSAAEVLAAARASRSVWAKGFPGFKADVTANIDGESKNGKLKIDASGSVELNLPAGKLADWASDQLESMVQHRQPDPPAAEGRVVFTDDDTANPLGRKIALGDDRESSYRIRDNAIMEVRRAAGPMRFTISVLEVQWNADKKYLPRSFVVNYFDAKSGELRESHAFRNQWQRVGQFDLPTRILEIAVDRNTSSIRQLELSNLELLQK